MFTVNANRLQRYIPLQKRPTTYVNSSSSGNGTNIPQFARALARSTNANILPIRIAAAASVAVCYRGTDIP